MLIESRSRATEQEGARGAPDNKPILGGVQGRVLLSFLLLLVVSTAASVLVLREVLLSRIDDRVDTELTESVESLQEASEAGRPAGGEPFSDARQLLDTFVQGRPPPPEGALVAYVDGREIARNSVVPDDAIPEALDDLADVSQPQSGSVEGPGGEVRYMAVPVSVGASSGVFVTAALTAAEREHVESAVRIAIGVSVVVFLLASLFIWLAAGRAIAPLKALTRTARSITDTDLSRRIPVRGSDEIAELGETFNGMLDRLETAFAGQKEFLSDVSHELRTPITVIRGHLETLGDSPQEREQAIAVIQGELDRMNRHVDDLLLLTKAPRPDFLITEPIDLDLFTQDLFAKARSLGDRDWRLDGTGVGIVVADPQRLTQAMMNLAENAAKQTSPGESIWLGSSLVGDRARLWVRDEGPGVHPDDRDRIFERFGRSANQSRISGDGAGLGLSIVRTIAEAHGGEVELDSGSGTGATFTIVLPAENGT